VSCFHFFRSLDDCFNFWLYLSSFLFRPLTGGDPGAAFRTRTDRVNRCRRTTMAAFCQS